MQRETLRTLPLKDLRSTGQLVHSDGLLSLVVVYGRKRFELTTKQGERALAVGEKRGKQMPLQLVGVGIYRASCVKFRLRKSA